MKKNNSTVHNNKPSQPLVNPRGEMSQKRADLKEKATLQKDLVAGDLKKIKKDAGKVLLVAGAAFVTFQLVKAITKETKKPEPSPTPNPPHEEQPPVSAPPSGEDKKEEKGFGQMLFDWVKGQVISYAAEKVKDQVWKYVQSRINKQQNAEEHTSDTDREKTTRD